MNSWQEWRCGTDPTDSFSLLRLLTPQRQGAKLTLTWQSAANVEYFLERSSELTPSNFTVFATNLTGQAGTMTYTDSDATSVQRFYRVGVSP